MTDPEFLRPNPALDKTIRKAERVKEAHPPPKSEEFLRFEAVMKHVMSISKEELDRRLAAAKKKKDASGAKRYPKK